MSKISTKAKIKSLDQNDPGFFASGGSRRLWMFTVAGSGMMELKAGIFAPVIVCQGTDPNDAARRLKVMYPECEFVYFKEFNYVPYQHK